MAYTDKDYKVCGHGSGRPKIRNMHEYCEERYNKLAPNGKHKGVICVKRHKKMTDTLRKELIKAYDIIIGRNYYNQDRRSYVFTKYKDGNYYSDCSSSIMASMRKIGLNVGSWLLNTAGIYESSLFETVDVKIKNGHITNPEVLKVGDCLLYVGNDPSRPCQIGHVNMIYSVPAKKASTIKAKTTQNVKNVDTPINNIANSASKALAVPYMLEITAKSINVRKNAGTQYEAITAFKQGDICVISKVKNGWGYANKIGWVSLKPEYSKAIASFTGKVTAGLLNVREKANTNCKVLKTIKKNTTVNITKLNNDATWGYDSKTKGWVSLKFIKC